MTTRHPRALASAAVLVLALAAAACDSQSDEPAADPTASSSVASPSAATSAATATADSSTCNYVYEWLTTFRFPLQPDPHAAYTYVLPLITDQPVGFEINGDLPYASWTEWMVYTGLGDRATPFASVEGNAIVPEQGSVNTFTPGEKVLAPERAYRMLVVPKGTDTSSLPGDLANIPTDNVMASPTGGSKAFIIANRVYDAFPGYNQGGAAGPTDTAFPVVRAVDLTTGDGVDCSRLVLAPPGISGPPTEMPSPQAKPGRAVTLADGSRFGAGPGSIGSRLAGMEYAPALDPDLIEFTRPPLLPGADVSSVPPPDSCAGYLGAAIDPQRIGLIRIPEVPHWFDTTDLGPDSEFVQKQATYVSLTQYGASVGTYAPGRPETASIANKEFQLDSSRGSTIVIWPRSLSAQERRQVFALARDKGWVLMQGGEKGEVTTANLFLRMKGTAEGYQGGFTPTDERSGVPCYFDDHQKDKSWSTVTGQKYVASAASIGGAAPQGVNCSNVKAFLDGDCLGDLKQHIASTGGSYS